MVSFPTARQPKMTALRGWTDDSTAKWRALPWGTGSFPPRLFGRAKRTGLIVADKIPNNAKNKGVIVCR